ncbi:VPA1262 family N-terminal domain-containing protein [Alcaligenes sp. SJTW-7]|uniref:VPA1262 family N-terminal domain-containing protein n=1 Tax=Alcaligenes sp. SJTW-7 TaxID=3078429 RepID=UPI0039EA4B72
MAIRQSHKQQESETLWNIAQQLSHLQKLLSPGVIGNYKSFEVTEIVGFHKDRPKEATNFMSLLVAELAKPPTGGFSESKFLNDKKRIVLPETPWQFGVVRYRIATQRIFQALQNLDDTGEWKLGKSALRVGALTPLPPQFVASDAVFSHPWNGVLKNNFWEGSHVLELFDNQKTDVRFLLDEPRLLKQLAADVMNFVKMGIDGLSDRLGNILIQFPVTVVTTSVSSSSKGDFLVQPIWHHGTPARQLRVSCEKYEDTTVEGYGSKDVTGSQATFPLYSPGGGARYVLWDDQHQLVLGASAQTSFITSIGMDVHVVGESISTREFCLPLLNGVQKSVTIPLIDKRSPSIIGTPTSNPREPWRENRVFRDSLKSIQARREFVQYGGLSGAGTEDALQDIHALLRAHGKIGAWLWDPYLDARDILSTLFYCPHKEADLRALTAGAEPPVATDSDICCKVATVCQRVEKWLRTRSFGSCIGLKLKAASPPKQSWKDKQLEMFMNSMGNHKHLNLEFRIRQGNAGWPFHDRFLIFPSETGPATAWSLGTSINSFGKKHHILQKVADGELIRQAFLDLWDKLSGSDYLVWRTP